MARSKDNQKAAIRAFAPSFSGSTLQPFESLFGESFRKATDPEVQGNIFDAIDGGADDAEHFEVENSVTGTGGWFRFGHLPRGGNNLSEICAFRMKVDFNGEKLNFVTITLFVLNPRFLFSEHGYTAAVIGKDLHYTVADSKNIGLVVGQSQDSSGSTDDNAIFSELKTRLPQIAFFPPGNGWQVFAPDTLLGRIDIEMSWRSLKGKFTLGSDGKPQSKTVATLSGGTDRTRMTLFSPDLKPSFDGLLHESERFGISVEPQGAATVIVLGDHSSVRSSDKKILQAALLNFGLQSNFRGLVFSNVGAHWLDDGAMGANITSNDAKGAISFNENAGLTTPARLYVSVNCTIDPTNNSSYLKLLKPGTTLKPANTLKLSVAGVKVRSCSLEVEFASVKDGMNPYVWLSDRKASIALTSFAINGTTGTEDEYGIDIHFVANENAPLARFTASDLKISPADFTLVASVLTLAPVFKLASGKITGPKNKNDKRISFVEISANNDLAMVFGAAALAGAWFFREALHASEVRVTGARILSQPGTTQKRDTAILFDVETEFSVASSEIPLSSSKALAVRVENTGILYSNGNYRWVQALQGAFKVSVSDGSIWNFGGLGSLLKVKDVSLKLDDAPILDLTVGMSINLGVVTADDFKIEFDIGSPDLNVGIYPSKIKIDVPGALEGEGTLDFGRGKNFTNDVTGKLDLRLASGLRMAAAARVTKFQPDGTGEVTAFAAGAEVIFPTAIPFLATGLGIQGFEALYASHFRRTENPEKDGIPPSLDWLQRANGEVAINSIADKKLWEPQYDRWSYGLGALLQLEACGELLNLNTMLLVELPGPRIIAFAKANILTDPVPNKDKGNLTEGMLGVLELDLPNNRLILGASIDYKLAFMQIYGSIENQYSFKNLTDWHFYLGHFDRQVSAVLKLGGLFNAGVTGYFMAAGSQLADVPRGSRGTVSLPGLALALGARAYASIGGGGVYLRMEMQAFLDLSLSKDLYAAGGLELSGELFLFIAGIGASAELNFEFYSGARGTYLAIAGKVCGRIKIGFLKLEGCVGLDIGGALPQQIDIPSLIVGASLVSGTNVALFGQGVTGAVDSVLFTLKEGGAFQEFTDAPLDVVIAISMVATPSLGAKTGFLGRLTAASSTTSLNYGKKSGGYNLSAVTLRKISPQGVLEDIDYSKAAGVWWRSTQKPGNGQPLAVTLALLTRRPFAVQNAIPSEETMERWIDALTSITGICNIVPPQVGVHVYSVSERGEIDPATMELSWKLPGRFKDSATETTLNGARPGLLEARISQRAGYGTPNDRFAGYPRHLGRKVVEYATVDGKSLPFAFLLLSALPNRMDGPPTQLSLSCAGFVQADNEDPPSRFIELLVASEVLLTTNDFGYSCSADNGPVTVAPFVEVISSDGAAFHGHHENWMAENLGFLSLSDCPGYGKLNFARVIFDLKSVCSSDHPPNSLQLLWRDQDSIIGCPLFIGAAKFLSTEELQRFEMQKTYNDSVVGDLQAFLETPLVPVLDPGSKYELAISWATAGADIVQAAATNLFRFSTSSKPPSELAPYLLATFPEADEQLHPYGHQPGFSISSGDILRILQKYPRLRLKISVLEDGNNPVLGKDAEGNPLDWSQGLLYDPASLLDVLAVTPGLDRKWFNALPSPLLRAIKSAIAAGTLQCINNSIKLDQGQWLGIMANLDPLLGYTVRIELAGEDGRPWSLTTAKNKTQSDDAGADPPFLRWHFRTGVQKDLNELRDLFARPSARNRELLQLSRHPSDDFATELHELSQIVDVCDEYADTALDQTAGPPVSSGKVALIPDKALEDTVAKWLGERPTLNSETEKTIVWGNTNGVTAATAIVLRSREPMLRRTQTAKISHVDTDAGSADVLKLDRIVTRFPSLAESKGVSAVYVSASGTCAVAIIDPGRTDHSPITIGAEEYSPHYLPYGGAAGRAYLVQVDVEAPK